MVFTIDCSKCGKRLWFAPKMVGKRTMCPACGGMMVLSPSAGQIAAAASALAPVAAANTIPTAAQILAIEPIAQTVPAQTASVQNFAPIPLEPVSSAPPLQPWPPQERVEGETIPFRPTENPPATTQLPMDISRTGAESSGIPLKDHVPDALPFPPQAASPSEWIPAENLPPGATPISEADSSTSNVPLEDEIRPRWLEEPVAPPEVPSTPAAVTPAAAFRPPSPIAPLAATIAADGSGFYVVDDTANPNDAVVEPSPSIFAQSLLPLRGSAVADETALMANQGALQSYMPAAAAPFHQAVAPLTPRSSSSALPAWTPRALSGSNIEPSPQTGLPTDFLTRHDVDRHRGLDLDVSPSDIAPFFDPDPPPQSAYEKYASEYNFDPPATPIRINRWIVAAATVMVLLLVCLLTIPFWPHTPDWERTHRDEILDLKQTAENLEISGDRAGALSKYHELERLVLGQTIRDPDLKDEVARARTRSDELLKANMVAAPPAEVVTTPSPQPAVSIVPAPNTGPSAQTTSAVPVPPAPTPPPPTVSSGPPAIHPVAMTQDGLTDEQVGASITRGIDFLLSRFDHFELPRSAQYRQGLDSLAIYALMQASLATHDKRLDIHGVWLPQAIAAMKKFPMKSTPGENVMQTYSRALRTTALALYNRPEDAAVMQEDVHWLIGASYHGAYTYGDEFPRTPDFLWDNSNSQYGLLGVWSGAEAGISVPSEYWHSIEDHWSQSQLPNGQWSYVASRHQPSLSMTFAGIASLFVAQDYLDAEKYGDSVGRQPFSPALEQALAWLEDGENSLIKPSGSDPHYEAGATGSDYYAAYGLERVGLASGFKYFGKHDWYREEAAQLIANQDKDGSWGNDSQLDGIVDTSYAMLFLARGRHPVIMNKLRYAGNWANRPRDISNLARYASGETERPLNWQVVPISRDWHDWTDSAILYLAGEKDPNLSAQDAVKIKSYIQNGGMLLTQADGGSSSFSEFVENLGISLFRQYPWTDLPANHPLLSDSYRIANAPKIRIITNGSRILMMHFPEDISINWQLRRLKQDPTDFQLGINTIIYAAGKGELKNRLQRDDAPDFTPTAGSPSLPIGLISYSGNNGVPGNWNPEPMAWDRGGRWFHQQTGLDIAPAEVPLEQLNSTSPKLAQITGTEKLKLDDSQIQIVRNYVNNGGVLLISPCGAGNDFLNSMRDDVLPRAFANVAAAPAGSKSSLLTASADGMTDISSPIVREFVRSLPEQPSARPLILNSGKGHVIILPMDMISGLLGTNTWGILGYQSAYSMQLMKNIVLWTWAGK